MKGIELTQGTQTGLSARVWIPLDSIALVQPYIGFDTKVSGTELILNNKNTLRVTEEYSTVTKSLRDLKD